MVKRKYTKTLFWKLGLQHSFFLFCYIAVTLLLNVILILGNDYLARATDLLMAEQAVDFQAFFLPLSIMVVLGALLSYVSSLSGSYYSARVQRDVRGVLGNHLLELPFSWFDEKGTGSIMTKLVTDIGEAGRFFSEIMPALVVDFITVTAISIYLFQMDALLLVVSLVTYPVFLLAANKLSRFLARVVKKRKTSLDARNQVAYDAIQGMEVVRSYNLYEIMQQQIDYYIDDVAEQGCKSTRITSLGHVLRNIVTTIPIVMGYLFALREVLAGRITTGDMLAFSVLFTRIGYPLSNLVYCVNDIREISVSLDRIEEIYEAEPEKSGQEKFVRKSADDAVITFENVDFSYDGEHPALRHMSFAVKAGQTVAFAGGSGEGKSTIFRILCGFYEKQGGSYSLFGHPYEEWDLQAARDCFSYVSQNVFLFPESILNNVAYGKRDATQEEVMEACRNANIHDFIAGLPEGYQTMAGERGVRLSGGERQRISIARAFLKDAPILLLDEPTAAVDAGTEELLSEALERVCAGKTVLVIAHRLSTIRHAHRIYVVNKGAVAEAGTHEELLARNGIYAGMYGEEVSHEEKTE